MNENFKIKAWKRPYLTLALLVGGLIASIVTWPSARTQPTLENFLIWGPPFLLPALGMFILGRFVAGHAKAWNRGMDFLESKGFKVAYTEGELAFDAQGENIGFIKRHIIIPVSSIIEVQEYYNVYGKNGHMFESDFRLNFVTSDLKCPRLVTPFATRARMMNAMARIQAMMAAN